MKNYLDLGRNSGVSAYEIGSDFIKVQFSTGKIYTYNNKSVGSQNIQTMKNLAISGSGLNSFINKNVKDKFV